MNVNGVKVVKLVAGRKDPAEKGWRVTPRPTLGEALAADPSHSQWGMLHGPINDTWLLDLDTKSGGPESLARLVAQHGPLPPTPRVRTRNNGWHYIFRWDDLRPIKPGSNVIPGYPGIDTRGEGSYSAIPPSDGYTWLDAELEPAEAPDWLYALIQREELATDDTARPPGLLERMDDARAHARAFPPAVQGQNGSGRAFELAMHLVRGYGLTVEHAVQVMEEEWNDRCQPPWTSAELEHKCQDVERNGRAAWGYRWYYGNAGEVLLRSIRAYGEGGNAEAYQPYRVWPDGRMQALGPKNTSIAAAFVHLCQDAGLPVPSPEQAQWFAGWWRAHVRPEAPFPKAIAVDDEPGPSLARVCPAPGPTPAWDEFLNRLDCPDTFLAWVWMLTLPKQTRRVLWVTGDGHDGKTVVSRALTDTLGQAAVTLQDSDLDSRSGASRWTTGRTFGKRLLVIDDTKMRQLTRRGPLHQLTGGSKVPMERKGQDGQDMEATVAILITSNVKPETGKGRADSSRLLPLRVAPGPDAPDIHWERRLHAEMPALWFRAREAYERLKTGPGQPDIRVTAAVRANLDLAGHADDEMYEQELARVGLTLDPDKSMLAGDLLRVLGWRAGSTEWKDLRAWLLEQGVTSEKTREGAKLHGIGSRL